MRQMFDGKFVHVNIVWFHVVFFQLEYEMYMPRVHIGKGCVTPVCAHYLCATASCEGCLHCTPQQQSVNKQASKQVKKCAPHTHGLPHVSSFPLTA